MKYITVLDFETGRVYQYEVYDVDQVWQDIDYEKYLTEEGHNLSNCEWMVHSDSEIVSRKAQWTRFTK